MKKHLSVGDHFTTFRENIATSSAGITLACGYEGETYDKLLHAWLGKGTGWLSPASLSLAIFDWSAHLHIAPAKQWVLTQSAWKHVAQFIMQFYAVTGCYPSEKCSVFIHPRIQDHRFSNMAWELFPFNLYSQAFLLYEKWWDEATLGIRGVSKHHEHVVNFVVRQLLDMVSPSNFPFSNPEVIAASIQQGGANFVAGFCNTIEDTYRFLNQQLPVGTENFPVGVQVATTPGKVIYRNHLIELIQYTPVTQDVYAEPVLIIPAWIMKYYILDLSRHNSLVNYLVGHGHTVFMISWRNPTSEDRDLGLEDYLNLGVMNALDVINAIIPHKKIHATGYCLGGTLLMIAAAAMALMKDDRFKSITLFAAQVDFHDSGELSLFVDQSQVNYLEDIMWEKGYLDGTQMAWAFSMLRSNDLIWSRMIHDYLLGKRRPMNDLMAWDSDTTRLPLRMHADYLRDLFLNNELVRGRYKVGKKKIALTDITIPIFAVGTLKDHVSPWRLVYKAHLFTNTDITFVLTSGGHNAGIVSEPGHKNRTYQIKTRKKGDKYISSDTWLESAKKTTGSWWPEWEHWLAVFSEKKVAPPLMGNLKKGLGPLCDAPGTYVLQR